jgi:hypothetical protein
MLRRMTRSEVVPRTLAWSPLVRPASCCSPRHSMPSDSCMPGFKMLVDAEVASNICLALAPGHVSRQRRGGRCERRVPTGGGDQLAPRHHSRGAGAGQGGH